MSNYKNIHYCYKCLEPFIFNDEYYDLKRRDFDLSGVPMKLNLDGSGHECQDFNKNYDLIKIDGYNHARYRYFILPGEELFDFYRLVLAFEPTINGFTAQKGKILSENNRKFFPFTNNLGKVVKLSSISLSQFLDIHFSKFIDEFHLVFDIRTKTRIPTSTFIVLLLRNKGIDFIGPDKKLVWQDEKFNIIDEE